MGFKTFFNNLRYLFRYNLKEMSNYPNNTAATINNLRYELADELPNLKRPYIKSIYKTIEDLIEFKRSIARYGDGEFNLILGNSIPFQEYDEALSERLKEILISNDENICVAINRAYFGSLEGILRVNKLFVRSWNEKYRDLISKYLDFDKTYHEASITQVYMGYDETFDFENYYNNIRQIWENRDIFIIKGAGITDKFAFDVFDNAKTIEHIEAPSKNAYSKYEEILKNVMKVSKDKLVLIILGPTATVLAYDLAQLGYQALDIGHLAKDYDAYKNKIVKNTDNILGFFQPD